MSFRFLTLALPLAGLLAFAAVEARAADMIPPEMATRFVGKDGMVCGKVEKAKYAQNSEGEPTFLYMGGAFPRHTFSARIPGSVRAQFNPAPEALEGKDVCVIGSIARDASRAEIVVAGPANVKLATIN
ncbi:hypothetical protein [Coralloluteibacterium stylophorae]|uniref:DNA-binding protein n=1 Tax=Coralloluteibacterium stylophorae TaxID=1776034 RepID=A0A8J7VSE7_9GAMM|nr:hypothetical protein [Coralloluteibacterium stylophorae]MBS7457261.1 hypothetical protein [Coralloluteibacterium stylophorae]